MKKFLMLSLITLLVTAGCTTGKISGNKDSEDQIIQNTQGSFDTPATIITMENYEIHAYSFVDGKTEKINETISETYPFPISWTESPEVQSFGKEFFYLNKIRKGEPGDMIRPLEETQIIRFDPYKNTKEILHKLDENSMIKRWKPTSEGIFLLIAPPTELYAQDKEKYQEEYGKLLLIDYEEGLVDVISENILELGPGQGEIDPYWYSEIFHPSKNIYSLIVDEYFSDGKTVTTVPYLFQYDTTDGNASIEEIEFVRSPMTASLCHQGDNLFWQEFIPRNEEGELIEIYKTYQTNLITGETKILSDFKQNMGIDILFCKDDYIVAKFDEIEINKITGSGTVYLIKNGEILDTFTGILLNANDNYIVYDSTDDLNNIEEIMIYNIKTGESIPLSVDVVTRNRNVYLDD